MTIDNAISLTISGIQSDVVQISSDNGIIWRKKYKIDYNKGANGSGTNTSIWKPYNTNVNLLGSTYTRSGYIQDGWATTDNGSKVYNLGATFSDNSSKTLYPYWKQNIQWIHGAYCNGGVYLLSNPGGSIKGSTGQQMGLLINFSIGSDFSTGTLGMFNMSFDTSPTYYWYSPFNISSGTNSNLGLPVNMYSTSTNNTTYYVKSMSAATQNTSNYTFTAPDSNLTKVNHTAKMWYVWEGSTKSTPKVYYTYDTNQNATAKSYSLVNMTTDTNNTTKIYNSNQQKCSKIALFSTWQPTASNSGNQSDYVAGYSNIAKGLIIHSFVVTTGSSSYTFLPFIDENGIVCFSTKNADNSYATINKMSPIKSNGSIADTTTAKSLIKPVYSNGTIGS